MDDAVPPSVLAMFPLGMVLFPMMALPLHVFEPRYRALVAHCLEGDGEFGVTLIVRGHEVGGGDVRSSVGCRARIVRAEAFPDGRWALLAVGTSRLVVRQWLPDDPYPRALVTDLVDPEPAPELASVHSINVALLRRCLALQSELGLPSPPLTTELSEDLVSAGYQAAALAPVGAHDHHRLLAAPDPSVRAHLLGELLAEQAELLELRLSSDPGTSGG